MTQHDYKAALEILSRTSFPPEMREIVLAIAHALKVADKLMQDPSEEMSMVGQVVPIPEDFVGEYRTAGYGADKIFKAMRAQMLKEVE